MRRLLKRQKGYPDTKKTIIVYTILNLLDKVLDALKNSGRQCIALELTTTKESEKLMNLIHESIIAFYKLYYKFDNDKVLQISELRDTILKRIRNQYEDLTKEELIVVSNLAQILELIQASTELRIALEY